MAYIYIKEPIWNGGKTDLYKEYANSLWLSKKPQSLSSLLSNSSELETRIQKKLFRFYSSNLLTASKSLARSGDNLMIWNSSVEPEPPSIENDSGGAENELASRQQ